MLEVERDLCRLGWRGRRIGSELGHIGTELCQAFIRGVLDRTVHRHVLKPLADFQNGADLLPAEHAAVVAHDGDQRIHIAVAAVIRHKSTLAGMHFQKALPGKLCKPAVDHGAADVHLFRKLPFRRQAGAFGQFFGEDHALKLLDEKLLQAGGVQFLKFHGFLRSSKVLDIPQATKRF